MSNIVYEYIVLTDAAHNGTVVRCNGRLQYVRKNGEWIRSGVLMEYFNEESPLYEHYREITEEEAMILITEM